MADGVILYLARRLHAPLGAVLERYVVLVSDGRVLGWYPFDDEVQSMLLVDEMFLSRSSDGTLLVESVRF